MPNSAPAPIPANFHPLDAIFKPRNVAVIGATDTAGSVGRMLVWNLLSNPFGGAVFPVNPNKSSVLGIKTYSALAQVPDPVDLAVIVTPAATVPDLISQCVEASVRGAIIVSAGFKETGAQGAALEQRILQAAGTQSDRPALRIIGPNCLGVMSTSSGLNATFASAMAKPGNVAFLSQSGALCTAVLDWSLREGVGFSHFVSVGSMLDVDWSELIYYIGDDARTKSIIMYCETIGDARGFMSAAREVSLSKPIIMIKPGRTDAAARAAASHTGASTGSDDVVDAALRRAGVIRVSNISDLFYMSETLARQPKPRGKRLSIVTNAGGPGVIAADALIAGGGELGKVAEATMCRYNEILPAAWSHANPIDMLGDATPERFARAVEVAMKDDDSDGVLVVLAPQAVTDPTRTAEALRPFAKTGGKTLLASWMGGSDVAAGEAILNTAGIPTFSYPDTACRIWNFLWQYNENLRALYETPSVSVMHDADAQTHAMQIIARARGAGRANLTEGEARQVLALYGITTGSAQDAAGYELCLRSRLDPQFGPMIEVGSGGHLADAINDCAIGLPPLNSTFAALLLEHTQIINALRGARGRPPVDLAVLQQVMIRFSQLVIDHRSAVREIEINPLMAAPPSENMPGGIVALSAHFVLHPLDIDPAKLPRMAIRPYPVRYVGDWALRDGTPVTIRPIRASDEPLVVEFHGNVSDQSVYLRYFAPIKLSTRISHERLSRICFNDYDREMALVVEREDAQGDKHILGIGRLVKTRDGLEGEYGLLIRDDMQRQGMGTELLRRLVEVGRADGLTRITAEILPENMGMRRASEKVGFTVHYDSRDQVVKSEMHLSL